MKIRRIRDSVVDGKALCVKRASFNGGSFQEEAVASHNGYQYATYWHATRQLCVARRRLPDGAWEVIRFGKAYTTVGNDLHNQTQLGISPKDGTIHLTYNHHCHPLRYCVSKKGVATAPEEHKWVPGLFSANHASLNPGGKRIGGVTYPRFTRTPRGGLLLYYRTGSSGNGDGHLARYDPEKGVWTRLGHFVSRHGTYQRSKSRNAYFNGLDFDLNGRLHVTWCWRERNVGGVTNHDVCYAYSDNLGVTWFNNTGERIGESGKRAIQVNTQGIVVRPIPMNRGMINQMAQAVDRKGRVHVVTWHVPPDARHSRNYYPPNRRYYHYWVDSKGKWHSRLLPGKGTRPQLLFDREDTAFLVFSGAGKIQIASASADDHWTKWAIVHCEGLEPPGSLGQTRVDRARWARERVLSIYTQERPAAGRGHAASGSPLHVMDFSIED